MIRIRSQKLLSGVSTLAMLASFGIANPAMATDQTFTGPGIFPEINTIATDTFILVQTGAVIDDDNADPTIIGNSLTNTFNITQAGDVVDINASVLLGNILNSGTFNSTADDGIQLQGFAVVAGGIFNSGRILGGAGAGDAGIEIDASVLAGGIHNTSATSRIIGNTGIAFLNNSVIEGGITNAGTIQGTAAAGISFTDADIDFKGGITNSAGGTIIGAGQGINLDLFDTFQGDISNSGRIEGAGGGTGIWVDGLGTITGDINNSTSGIIIASAAGGRGIAISDGTIDGDLINSGTITAAFNGIHMFGGLLDGEIQNNSTGLITATAATGVAVRLTGGTITGGMDNAGRIIADLVDSTAILIADNTFDGGITNTGTVSANGTGGNAIVITGGGTFTGGIHNTGTGALIRANGNTAILVELPVFDGDITNSGSIVSTLNDAITIDSAVVDFNGDFTNSEGGYISAQFEGFEWGGTNFNGDITNDGSIVAGSSGIRLTGTDFNGSVTNTGYLQADNDGIKVQSATTVTGDITNTSSGTITSLTQDGIDINGTVEGDLDNAGIINGDRNGIDIDGVVEGTIINTGTIIGNTEGGIDLDGAGAAHTITQTAGLISDGGEASYAINMNNSFSDTFNANGGSVEGDIEGGEGNVDNMVTSSGTFAWLYGDGFGFDEFDVDGGTSILGASARGDTGGEGVVVNNANTMNVDGHVYLDDDTTITLNTSLTQGGEGTIEWFLTTDTGNYGVINAPTATLAGEAAVYVDAADFANNNVVADTPFTYEDVIDAGTLNGAFTNSGTVTTSSIFFTATAIEDGGNNIDIVLTRLAMNDALEAAGATESANQEAVAGALEEIYNGGEYQGGEFEDFFTFLFDANSTPEDIQNALDEISGSEYAQNQQMALNITGQFNDILGMRLDQTLGSSTGGGMASLGGRQYADAGTTASDGSASAAGGSHGLNRGPSGVSVWLRGFGQWVNVDADPNAAGYDQDTSGAVGGIDYAVANNATLGVAGSWSKTNSDFDTPGDSTDIDSWQAGAYGSVGFGRFYVDGSASYAAHDVTTLRTIAPPVPNAPFFAEAAYDTTAWTAQGEFGMMFRAGRVNLQPSVGLAYADATADAFTETGDSGAYTLIVDEASAESFASTVALRASGEWKMGRTRVMPEIRIGWRHEFENDPYSFTAVYDELNAVPFTIISSELQQDSAVVRAGATFGLTRNIEVFVNLNGQYSSDAAATNGSGGLRLTW